jgi:hypothetical protein
MRVFSTLVPRSNENKNCMRVDESSWEARVCMRVFSTLVPRSNENKNCMRVDKSWEARVCMRVFSTLVPRSNENKNCTRVDWILSILSTLINFELVQILTWTDDSLTGNIQSTLVWPGRKTLYEFSDKILWLTMLQNLTAMKTYTKGYIRSPLFHVILHGWRSEERKSTWQIVQYNFSKCVIIMILKLLCV